MPKNSEKKKDKNLSLLGGIRQMEAPGDYHPFGVLSVWLGEDEEVIWNWSHADGKSYVCGYSIEKKNLLDKNPLPRN